MNPEQQPDTPKKRRTRRVVENPESVQSIPTDEPEKTKKERKPRSPKKGVMDTDKLARQIMGGHLIAAQFLGPEIAIDETESKMLAESVVNLAEQYDIVVSGKTAAWLGLIATAAIVYGPRVPALVAKVKAKAKRKALPVPITQENAAP